MALYNDIHVYYVIDFSLGVDYDIIVSLFEFNDASEIKCNDNTKNITNIEYLEDHI